jgi:hypothetical protein
MKTRLILATVLSLVAATVHAGTNTFKVDTYPLCITEDAFHEIIQAAGRKDKEHFVSILVSGQCIFPKIGQSYSLLDYGLLGTSKVKIYVNGRGIVVYTNSEAVSSK